MDKTSIKKIIEDIKVGLYSIIAQFQCGYEYAGKTNVAVVTQKLLKILSSIESSGIREVLNIDYNKLNTILINVSKSLETENYILIDDLFEYELIPMFDIWISKLEISISKEAEYEEK